MSNRPRRSALYLPASNIKAIAKARALPCDVVILDLEDAVAPASKAEARALASAAIREGGFGHREVVVRINALSTPWGMADLEMLADTVADGVLLPKINGRADIAEYSARLQATRVPFWAMIETALSLFRLEEIASAANTDGLVTLVMGTNDLAKETGAVPDAGRTPFLAALSLAVAAGKAHGLSVLDGVYNDIANEEGFIAEARQAVSFGFDGKTLIHPSQIKPCHHAFAPDDAAITAARRICEAFDSPENAGNGVIRLDGQMVERLHLHQARRILAAVGVEADLG